jgi:hypothetical protein
MALHTTRQKAGAVRSVSSHRCCVKLCLAQQLRRQLVHAMAAQQAACILHSLCRFVRHTLLLLLLLLPLG